ncbi:UNVERIFIED_CONTAM: hypothetical protein Sradi_1567000 [Sesamum radiatum]|uniref:Retrovirus-related Pol polyprotein from transposon TNT 1-94 n=1 Tax=Sesamum radiatum TaxID=300843 RepID=A0AAW2U934_SESRA
MSKAKPVSTPLANHFKLSLEQCPKTDREIKVMTKVEGPICWKSTVQYIVALFKTEEEYMTVAKAAKEALWFNGLAKELGVEQGGVQLQYDSQSVIFG